MSISTRKARDIRKGVHVGQMCLKSIKNKEMDKALAWNLIALMTLQGVARRAYDRTILRGTQ